MFCQKCGTSVEDGVAFCPNCGNAMPAQQPVYPQSNVTYTQTPVETSVTPGSILAMGIVALALVWCPLANIASIVVGAICGSKVNTYYSEGGIQCGQVNTGRILGKIGFIAGICTTAFWFLYFILIFFIAAAAM